MSGERNATYKYYAQGPLARVVLSARPLGWTTAGLDQGDERPGAGSGARPGRR